MALPASPSKERQAEPIGGLVEAVLADLGLTKKLQEYRVLAEWKEAVGPTVATWAQPKRLHKGRLEVAVKSAVWRTQLSFVKQEIVKRINERIGQEVVRELVLFNQR